jgi:hypothetical protein
MSIRVPFVNIKNIVVSTLAVVALFAATVLVFAQSGTYNTSYDMTGGVYTQQTWNASATPTFVVETTPSVGVEGAIIREFLQKNATFGWSDVASKDVSSQNYAKATLVGSDKGEYRIYFRNYSGFQMKGSIKISYSW